MTASPRDVVRIGVIGAGSFAQNVLLPAIKSDSCVELRTVVTTSGLSATSVAKRFGFANAASDPAAVFDDPEIDAVVIATRHDSHASLAAEALRRGKAVFVEKPLAIDRAGLDDIVAARAEGTSDIMVGFNRRFAPATITAKQWIGGVAEPKVLICRVNAGLVPRTHWIHDPDVGGGRIIGEGCHFLDLLGFLAGSAPVEVETTAMPDCDRYSRDNVVVRIRYADGSIATMTYVANGAVGVSKEHIEIFAGGRVAIIDDFRRLTLASSEHAKRVGGRFTKQDKGHKAEMASFLTAIRRGTPSPIPFHELVTTTRLTLRAMESLQSGRAVSLI
jgi:predicted dehydrogenase